ncbi:hypothetical protein [Actinacidiphila acidipaludis]|uniref:Uncharacterized protein n=1 Tax=Actinacidiphila acidipaludis TaxID=2873382 RepID=A0ABS7QGX1_9ACTN|nr:hypothetical protein [Streptomyces acidipaludis]MBY8882417.1 hypothetical protein [Streptomyces acidipaludis]
MTEHAEECRLNPKAWLRHAAGAAGACTMKPPDPLADRAAAVALTDALAYFAELGDLPSVTLADVARHALVMEPADALALCDCGAARP